MDNIVTRVPRELEREILELAAEMHSTSIISLLLVAKRTFVWLEPYIFRKVHLSGDSTGNAAQEAFLHAAVSKPPPFLANGVRRIVLSLDAADPHMIKRLI
ncbi:hypothetical protein MIND_00922900 [Mycena indigotica]|uniref:Uncharacterized protein n=1 Tax=Mycena indigotica TaxID=2126181 RepID=A0A8H6VYW3_9AGAR|nr:uncharacterized protein MIND_00922900 [Mycena indigotica]KAF7296911.1 hypothetical protein MIND_00922900 [Mycena indigotica]